MDVPTRHAPDPQPAGELGEGSVAGPVVACVWPLQLHIEVLRTEPLQQPVDRSPAVGTGPQQRALGAPRQADQPLRMVDDRLHPHRRLPALASPGPVAGLGMGGCEDAAEVAPALLVADQQCDVAGSISLADGQVDLGAVDRSDAAVLGRLGQLHRA